LTAQPVPEEFAAQILERHVPWCGPSQSDTHRWLRFAHLVDRNAILKLHCATSPALPPEGQSALVSLTAVRLPVPYPPHPGHVRRTSWVSATELVGDGAAPLRKLVDVGAGAGSRLDFLTEYVMRPLVVVFRELADDPGRDLFVLDVDAIGLEVTTGGRLTGRVVASDAIDLPRHSAAACTAVRRGVRRLADYLTTLAQRCDAAGLGGPQQSGGPVQARLDEVLARELRFLRPETVTLLGEDHPWAGFLHAVDADQDRNLRSVLRAVAECARQRRADPTLPPPLVLVDQALSGVCGLRRFAWDVCDAGGRLVIGAPSAEHDPAVARFVPGGTEIAVRCRAVPPVPPSSTLFTVTTFETLPRSVPPGGRPTPSLSHTRSLEELQLAELRPHRIAHEYAVRMSARESVDLIRQLVATAEVSAARAAAGAAAAFGDAAGPHERLVRQVRHLLTRKQFIKGSRSYYPHEQAMIDMLPFVRDAAPIRVRMMGFPLKQWESGLKALGGLPDLAEVGALVRLRELHRAVQHVYPPGIRLTVLTDAKHFRPRSAAVTRPYERKVEEYAQLVGCDEFLRFVDVDTCAADELGVSPDEHRKCVSHHRQLLESELSGMDITHNPLGVLRAVAEIDGGSGAARSVFRDLFMSIVFSVPVPLLAGADRMASSAAIYDDLYRLDGGVSAEVAAARREVLSASWDATVRYVSTLRANRDLDYDDLFTGYVRLKASAPRPGTCGFSFLGGSCLLPWQGTGAVSARGEVSTDFAVSLLDQGFVPVFSPLLGDTQPWLMVPVTATQVVTGASAAQLDHQFAARIRLRRR
jgi:hypothetical protein